VGLQSKSLANTMHSQVSIAAVVALIALAVGVFAQTALQRFSYEPDSEIAAPFAVMPPTATAESIPARLQIPSLNIDTRVQQVGLTTKGNMGVPTNFKDVGWYKYGTVPGQLGSAVIGGHVDNALALAGVFKRLDELLVGDSVYVVTADGTKLRFVVTDIESYPYTEAPANIIFTQNDAARLNLITCAGSWIPSRRTYDKRLVIYTKFADSVEASGL